MTGIGISDVSRKNGMALTTSGDLRIKGKVYIGCNDDSTGGTEAGTGGSKVQSDWDENLTTSEGYIKNRPSIRMNGHTSNTGMNTTGIVVGYSGNVASGNYSLAEGYNTQSTGENSHAEGNYSVASGRSSHAEGGQGLVNGLIVRTTASGGYSHAEGSFTVASGAGSHAEGGGSYDTSNPSNSKPTTASGMLSHAEG